MGYIDVAFQTYTFLFSVALGALLCLLYDLLKALHLTCIKNVVAVFITDILFFIFAAMATYCFLILTSKGQVRMFVISGIALGFFTFRLTLSRFTVLMLVKVIEFFRSILHVTSKFTASVLSTINKYLINVANSCKKLLQPRLNVLYNCIKVLLSGKKGNRNGGSNQTEG